MFASTGVRVVLEAVCILKGVKAIRFKDPQSGQMVDSYWEASKKMLMDEDFLLSLRYAETACCSVLASLYRICTAASVCSLCMLCTLFMGADV